MKIVNIYNTLILSVFCCVGSIANAAPPITVAPQAIPANKITLVFSGMKLQSEALGFQFGAENSADSGSGGGGAGKARFKDIIITRRVDAFSKDVPNAVTTGQFFDEVIIRQGGLTVQCKLATISDYQIDGEAGFMIQTAIERET